MKIVCSDCTTRIGASMLILLALGALFIGPKCVRSSFLHTPWDQAAEDYFEGGMVKAGVAFGASRVINAAISFAQDADVSLEPAGVGVSFSPGEILDPLNDMVERFSSVMLFSMTVLGIQKILIALLPIVDWWVVMPFLLVVILGAIWLPSQKGVLVRHLAIKLLAFAAILRFFMPLEATFVSFLDDQCLQGVYESNIAEVREIQNEVKDFESKDVNAEESQSIWDRLKENLNLTEKIDNISDSVHSLAAMSESIFSKLIALSAVFLLQTIILPLGGAIFIYFGGKRILSFITVSETILKKS